VKPGAYREIHAGEGVSYTVPQKFRAENLAEGLELFLRVKNIYRNRRIEVRDGETTILSLKRPHLAPGEMERVLVPGKLLEGFKGDSLTVTLAGGEGA